MEVPNSLRSSPFQHPTGALGEEPLALLQGSPQQVRQSQQQGVYSIPTLLQSTAAPNAPMEPWASATPS